MQPWGGGYVKGCRRVLAGGFCNACTRQLKTHTLLFGEGACLVWRIYAVEPRLRTEKSRNMARLLSHLEASGPWVGRLHAVRA